MRKQIFFLIAVLGPFAASAQKYTAGIDIGFNNAVQRASVITSTQVQPLNTGTLPGMGVGIHAERHFGQFSIGAVISTNSMRFTITPQLGDGLAGNYSNMGYTVGNTSIPIYLSYYEKINAALALQFKAGLSLNRFSLIGMSMGGGGTGATDSLPVESRDSTFWPLDQFYYNIGFIGGITLRPLKVMKHFAFSLEYNNVFGITAPISTGSSYTHGSYKESAIYNTSLRPVYFSVKIGYELGKLKFD